MVPRADRIDDDGAMKKARFTTELIEGHNGVTVVLVPFSPEVVWRQKPYRLDARRDGWLVTGTFNRRKFDGYVGLRWGRYLIIVDPELLNAAHARVGDIVSVVVEPTTTRRAFERAREQSQQTTAPKKGRPDAIDFPEKTVTQVRARSSRVRNVSRRVR